MIDILVPEGYSTFNLYQSVGKHNAGGGVAIKYARCQEACEPYWEARRIESLEDIEGDILLAEFNCFLGGDWAEKVKAFLTADVRLKIICLSDLSILKAPKKLVQYLTQGAHGEQGAHFLTHNTKYQKRMLQCAGITNSIPLCDPTPETLFYPAVKETRLLCIGQMGWYKNTDAVLHIFHGLKDSEVKTCYIGGLNMWGNKSDILDKDKEIAEKVEEVADEFVENASTLQVASIVNASTFFVQVAFHDASNQAGQENLLAGNDLFGLTHPVNKERPCHRYKTPNELIEAVKTYDMAQFEERSEANRQFALDNYAYAKWQEQFSTILSTARQL